MKRLLCIVAILLIAALGISWWLLPKHTDEPGGAVLGHTQPHKNREATTSPGFDKRQYSLVQADSLWAIVNKTHPLQPKTYVPNDLILPPVKQRIPGAQEMKLRAAAANALTDLVGAAEEQGAHLLISTAYRSYSYQTTLYDHYVSTEGQTSADTFSARPGYSEHQTGLALDFRAVSGKCPLKQCFASTPEGKWLAANAYKYGFILRYPKDKDTITGYHYEPWHFRYVGISLSTEMHEQGVATLEEFFGVSGGPTY